jgi:hypothetical protein
MMFEELFRQRHTAKRPEDRGTDRPLAATILEGTTSVEGELFVLIATLGENARRGPCLWTPVPAAAGHIWLPGGGEDCVVQFADNGLPWIMKWIPNADSNKI